MLRPNRPLAGWAIGLLAIATTAPVAFAHDEVLPDRFPARELYRPTPVPDRICLSLTERPDQSVAVTWRTDVTVQRAVAQLGLSTDGPDFRDDTIEIAATTTLLESDLGPANYHEATFTDLKPTTKYLYRVGDKVNWSEWAEFETASDSAAPFSFVYFGDAQNDIKSHWSRVVRQAFRDAPKASFFLHAGDLVNRGASDGEWGEWFYSGGFIHRSIPAIAIPGNHEMVRRKVGPIPAGRKSLTQHWQPTFAFPQNGPKELPAESCYFLDFQGVRFVCLNSNEQAQVQAKWLDEVLDGFDGWKIVTHHHPIYSASVGRDNPGLRNLWQPIYDRHGVDLVLQGHDHTYARSREMKHGDDSTTYTKPELRDADRDQTNVAEGAETRSPGGTVYVVSVSGPKMYRVNKRNFMRSSAERKQLYQIVTVDGDELRYSACTANGQVYDEFTLIRHEDRPNELIETP